MRTSRLLLIVCTTAWAWGPAEAVPPAPGVAAHDPTCGAASGTRLGAGPRFVGHAALVSPVTTADLPVVLVTYPDLGFSTPTGDLTAVHDDVSDFYDDASGGVMSLTLEVVATHSAADPYASYGKRLTGSTGRKALADEVAAAISGDTGIDFTRYDANGDGRVDGLIVQHAGWGAETEGDSSDMVWSAMFSLTSAVTTWDGMLLSTSAIFPEYQYSDDPTTATGVIAHELGHVIGLPDLYDVDYDDDGGGSGLGIWSVMASGSWSNSGRTPVGFDAWSAAVMGWRPVDVVCGTREVTLTGSASDPVLLLWEAETTDLDGEFVLVDAVDRSGVDAGLPGEGIQVLHHDPAGGSWSNTSDDGGVYRVWVTEADATGDTVFDGDLYPGSDSGTANDLFADGTTFTASTVPAPATGAGGPLDVAIEGISAAGGGWTVTVRGYSCDRDGDGYVDDDCDDGDASVHPGAPETCDGRDEDCDGTPDEDAVDASTWHPDADGDGYGDPTVSQTQCVAPAGWVSDASDCDDADPTVNPETAWYRDGDSDGYGDLAAFVLQCDAPAGYVRDARDCDDTDATLNPETWWYADADVDAYGDPTRGVQQCLPPGGHVRDNTDCDDTSVEVHPGAADVCNGVDDDCDGRVDPAFDVDGDGWSRCAGDCHDGDAAVHPDATETCNQADDDCDGVVDQPFDLDGDGWATCGPLPDCDDVDPAVHPGAEEQCDGVDGSCRGALLDVEADADGDGVAACDGDCNDADPSVGPGATEQPNGRDDDCDDHVDEGTTASDDDGDGFSEASGDCDDTDPAVFPANGGWIDLDCDGSQDLVDADGDGWTIEGGDCDDSDPLVVACPDEPGLPDQSAGCNSVPSAATGVLGWLTLAVVLRRRVAWAALAGCGTEVGALPGARPDVSVVPARLDLPAIPDGLCLALPPVVISGPDRLVGTDWWPASASPHEVVTLPDVSATLPVTLHGEACGPAPWSGTVVLTFESGDAAWLPVTMIEEAP